MNDPVKTKLEPYGSYLWPVAVIAVGAGLFFRFWQMGGAPLATDEYYFGSSILNTLEHGVPAFPCGGFYTRGLLIQYLSIPLLNLGVDLEFATRFWPVIASIFTILAVWQIARIAAGQAVACIAVILCSLSVWEIEFARFGRMYAPFQALVLWYLYFQMLHLVKGREYARWAYLALSGLAVLVYAGAALLLVFNFLALIWRGRRWTVSHLVTAFALLVVGYVHQSTGYRYLGVSADQLPPVPEVVSGSSSAFDLPNLPETTWLIVIVGLTVLGCGAWFYRSRIRIEHPAIAFWLVAFASICFGLMGLGVGLLAAGLLMRLPSPVTQAQSQNRIWPAALGGLAILWSVITYVGHSFDEDNLWFRLKGSFDYVFNYPDVYYKVVLPWMQAIPVTTVALSTMILVCLWDLLRYQSEPDQQYDPLRYLFAAVILLIMLVGLLDQPYRTTRYTYFLYPVILVLASAGIGALSRRVDSRPEVQFFVTILSFGTLAGLAEDFNMTHLIHINEPEYRFRAAYNRRLAGHYYTRWDYRGAAEYINERMADEDKVVVFDQPATYYLTRTDGVFVRSGTSIHRLTWACGGERHLWSNAPLLDQDSDVEALVSESKGSTWFLMRTASVPWRDKLEVSLVERLGLESQYTSVDGSLEVYRVSLNKHSQ